MALRQVQDLHISTKGPSTIEGSPKIIGLSTVPGILAVVASSDTSGLSRIIGISIVDISDIIDLLIHSISLSPKSITLSPRYMHL
jgi:hypothetical protein